MLKNQHKAYVICSLCKDLKSIRRFTGCQLCNCNPDDIVCKDCEVKQCRERQSLAELHCIGCNLTKKIEEFPKNRIKTLAKEVFCKDCYEKGRKKCSTCQVVKSSCDFPSSKTKNCTACFEERKAKELVNQMAACVLYMQSIKDKE